MSYDEMAEYHEVHMQAAWDGLRDLVRATFAPVEAGGVIVDIGAGSGLGTLELAAATDAEIFALEPNATMRAMMVARLDTVGLLDRVTVVPDGVPAGLARLPDRVDGVLVTHMLGHLTPPDRSVLVEWIASSLGPGRSALVTVAPETGAEPAGENEEEHGSMVDERAVGRFTYRVTHHSPAPGEYVGRFEVVDAGGEVIRSLDDETTWELVTAADIAAMTTGRDVDIAEPQPGAVLITRN